MFIVILLNILFCNSTSSCSLHYGTPDFSWAFRQLCKPKQSLNNFILVLMKASTVLGTLQFAPDSFPELSNHQNLSQTSRNKRLNESQWVLMSVNETHQDSLSLTKTHWASSRLIKTHWDSLRLFETHQNSSKLIETHWDSLKLIETH